MDIWQAIALAKQGQPVRHPGKPEGDSIVYEAGTGTARAVAIYITAAGARRTVRNSDVALEEWNRDDWEVLT
jgi:hypothetical protein